MRNYRQEMLQRGRGAGPMAIVGYALGAIGAAIATGLVVGVAIVALTSLAHASPARHRLQPATGFARGLGEGLAHVLGIGQRPRAWCGWQMRQWLGGGPELNLARNWARVGQPSGAQVGAVVVWPHHVGLITGRAGNQWIVKSGNDGHRVRERPRSVAGAIAFRRVS